MSLGSAPEQVKLWRVQVGHASANQRKALIMCDYSLESIASRPAAIDDKLVVTNFRNSTTRGFASQESAGVAICLMPGTEIAFDKPIATDGFWSRGVWALWQDRHSTAIFRKINAHSHSMHHDALELPNGQTVLLTRLQAGQRARVLTLPVQGHSKVRNDVIEDIAFQTISQNA
jgi:hypothetical protein